MVMVSNDYIISSDLASLQDDIMSIRLVGKAFKLAVRSRRRFAIFTVVYSVLIALTTYSINAYYMENPHTSTALTFMIVVLICAIILSVFYANLIVTYRRMEIATLKCIGWRNNHVRILIVGEIFAVTLISFIIVIEFFFHWIAIMSYILPTVQAKNITPIQWIPLLITFGTILGVQVVAILIANNRILKVRPIQALQMQR